ncbi:MAG: hypothetical protein FWE67_11625 [Planctomycetaceae bacterium]|nr:hypothetical protein [Planctomycetaceae bacterium]
MKRLLIIIFLFTVIPAFATEFKIDADFPGGNILVSEIDVDTVRLQRRVSNETGLSWFYWSFRIRGAEGRTLNFELINGTHLSTRGPAVSNDDGITWRWLSDKTGFPETKFQYTFGPAEKEVRFSAVLNHTERDLKRFLEKYKDNVNLKIETLCQSKKGRSVELLRIPGKGNDADFKVCMLARHHARETAASYAVEGFIEAVLSDSDDGKWLREHCDFFIVPFVDKDGVEDGDQGKSRQPHDHNRDYIARIYPEVQAITEQVSRWQNGKPIAFFDMHGPALRAKPKDDPPENSARENSSRESLYLVGSRQAEIWKMQQRFSKILEAEKKGPLPFKESFNFPFGEDWNTAANYGHDGLLNSARWASSKLSNVAFSTSVEIPSANASGVVVDIDSLRFLGRDMAHALRVYLSE